MKQTLSQPQIPAWTFGADVALLKQELATAGVVMLNGIRSTDQLLDVMGPIGEVFVHRDSCLDGLTHIAVASNTMSRSAASTSGQLGFRQDGLFPHTDRSGLSDPPDLLAFWVEKQSDVGGSALFVDGYELFERLSQSAPGDLQSLMAPNSVVFKSEAGLVESSIFSVVEGRLRIRFRFDDMVYMSPPAAKAVLALIDIADKITICARLKSGEGYAVDNTRWLHGRTHFVGARSAYRLLLRSHGRPS